MHSALALAPLTLVAVLGGASVGREGPTVQIAAAVMGLSHRLLRVPLTGGAPSEISVGGQSNSFPDWCPGRQKEK